MTAVMDRGHGRKVPGKGKQPGKKRELTPEDAEAEMERMAAQARVYEAPQSREVFPSESHTILMRRYEQNEVPETHFMAMYHTNRATIMGFGRELQARSQTDSRGHGGQINYTCGMLITFSRYITDSSWNVSERQLKFPTGQIQCAVKRSTRPLADFMAERYCPTPERLAFVLEQRHPQAHFPRCSGCR